jgi:acetylornithine deacetylase/succinyl-diaminopimelate desuccinylase-like protein
VRPRCRAIDDVVRLVAIPSVSSMPEHHADVQRSADAVADLLREAGSDDVRVLSSGGRPAVVGRWPAPDGTPTVCLYAHHDVQPVGDTRVWRTPGFEATVVGDRLYGRGAGDDKGGIGVHLAALRAFGGRPPVGVTVFVEGEEEIGSPTLRSFISEHTELLRADAYVICDSGNWDVGVPAFTTTLRGVCDCVVEVATPTTPFASGAVRRHRPRRSPPLPPARDAAPAAARWPWQADHLRRTGSRLPGRSPAGRVGGARRGGLPRHGQHRRAQLVEAGRHRDRHRRAGRGGGVQHALPLGPGQGVARVAPGQRASEALDRLVEHLESHAPWGARVTVTRGSAGDPGVLPLAGPVAAAATAAFTDAFGVPPVAIGQGGSIPMAADFQQTYPDAAILLTAVCDPDSRMHGPNESLHLGDFAKAALAEALLLERLATPGL